MFCHGCYLGSWSYQLRLPHEIEASRRKDSQSTGFLELYAIAGAIYTFGPLLSRHRVVLHSDSEAARLAFDRMLSPDPLMLYLVRCIHSVAARLSFHLSIDQVDTKRNTAADHLSRCRVTQFLKLRPESDPEPTVMILHPLKLSLRTPKNSSKRASPRVPGKHTRRLRSRSSL